MTNIRKQLAKLNPRSLPLQVSGSRGTGESPLTALDIAAALAASDGDRRKRLAIDVLSLRWWPGRMEGATVVVGRTHERRRRADGKSEVVELPVERPAETAAFLGIVSLVARCLARRAEKVLDGDVRNKVLQADFLERWSRAVIKEFRAPHACHACQHFGRPGEVAKAVTEAGKVVRFEWALCEACGGTGVEAWGKYRRARAVRIREATFRNDLNEIHEGALALLRELEQRGARLAGRRISDFDFP